MSELLDRLLRPEIPNVLKQLPAKAYRVKRLSELAGEDVVFQLRALPYGRVEELKEGNSEEMSVQILLAGVVEPNLKDSRLAEKFGGATPAETVKAMLLPGEIEDISRAVERLCGYRMNTIEEVKNA
jgi:hypothetical protein